MLLIFQQQCYFSLKLPYKVQASEFSSINIDAGRCATGCFLSPLYLVQHINKWPMKHQSRLWCRGRREKNGNEKRPSAAQFEAGPARTRVTNLLHSSFLQLKFKTFFKKWPTRNKPKPGVQLVSTRSRETRHSLYLLQQALSLGLHLSSLREHNGRSQISRCASPPQAGKRHQTLDEQLWKKGHRWLLKPCYLISEEGSRECFSFC